MKFNNQIIAFAFTGLLFGLSGAAQAQNDTSIVALPQTDTYTFEAFPDNPTIFNGSRITISPLSLGVDEVAYSIVDTALSSTPFTGANEDSTITSYNTTDWAGSDLIALGFYRFTLDGTPDYISESTVEAPDPLANGVWTYAPAGVPDASSTFPLLLGVLAMLAGVHYCNRCRLWLGAE